ncbi:MAG: hypothetical protein RBU21_04630 [FCB group bacterium]|nr:hypothetical protein [FCB group bacterium]
MNEVKLNESGYAFVWVGRVMWQRRLKAIRWALRNLWNALRGFELSLQWDPEKMGVTRNRPTANTEMTHTGHPLPPTK